MITVNGIKNCDSVREAVKHLKEFKIPYEFIDFRETAKENMLIKRPVITFGNEIIVGYNRDEYLEKLPKNKG